MTFDFDPLSTAIQRGDRAAAGELTRHGLETGCSAGDLLHRALLPGMSIVGTRFRDREIFLPDVLLAARAMKAAMAILEPVLAGERVPFAGRVVLGTVRGDLHDIGKNLVGIMLQGAGYEVIDIGTDAEPDAFIDGALEAGAPLIGLSALLTTTMPEMAGVIERVHARGLAGKLKVIVGGAPVSDAFAREIGADGYAPDAPGAIDCVRSIATR